MCSYLTQGHVLLFRLYYQSPSLEHSALLTNPPSSQSSLLASVTKFPTILVVPPLIPYLPPPTSLPLLYNQLPGTLTSLYPHLIPHCLDSEWINMSE